MTTKTTLKAIDLFAGAGGFSTGASQAGAQVVFAANHWPDAVKIHQANHPGAAHACQDLQQCDWSQVPAHDILLASPCCQGFSKARGKDQARHDAARSTAWAVVSAAEFHRPRFFVVENVREFLDWKLYPAWSLAMTTLGYRMTINVLNAADFGVPQSRERVFIVGGLDQEVEIKTPGLKPIAASTIIDWTDPRFLDINAEGRRLGDKTKARIATARDALGDRCAIAYYGGERGGRSLDKPLGTLTTKDRFMIIDGDRAKILSRFEARDAMGFPKDYVLPQGHNLAIHMLGNAVCPPVAKSVVSQILKAA